jgi:hypothetical protein
MPSTRPVTQVRDIILAADNTLSMTDFGADTGLKNTIHNLGSLVDMAMKDSFGSTEEDKVVQDCARDTTFVHAYRFGTRCVPLHGDEFFPLTKDEIAKNVPKIEGGLDFSDAGTNIQEAVEYANNLAIERLAQKSAHDLANNIDRRVCLVLLTDGSPTRGSSDPVHILEGLALSGDKELSVYGIGLGTNTNPVFLSQICNNGFWKHVEDPFEPKEAFDVTIGYIIKAVANNDIDVRMKLEREGVPLDGPRFTSKTRHTFGLVTADKCRAMVLPHLALPTDAAKGDTLLIEYKFSVSNDWHSAKIEVTDDDNSGKPYRENMVNDLIEEADEIESMLDLLRSKIEKGAPVHSIKDELMASCSQSSSIRSQIRRVSRICEQSLSYASSVGTASFLPYQPPGMTRSAPVDPGMLPPLEPSYSLFEAQSSFSQF